MLTPDELRAMAARLEAEAFKLREEAARRDDPGKFSVIDRIAAVLADDSVPVRPPGWPFGPCNGERV